MPSRSTAATLGISARGYGAAEPVSGPIERPKLVASAIAIHREQHEFDAGDLARRRAQRSTPRHIDESHRVVGRQDSVSAPQWYRLGAVVYC